MSVSFQKRVCTRALTLLTTRFTNILGRNTYIPGVIYKPNNVQLLLHTVDIKCIEVKV